MKSISSCHCLQGAPSVSFFSTSSPPPLTIFSSPAGQNNFTGMTNYPSSFQSGGAFNISDSSPTPPLCGLHVVPHMCWRYTQLSSTRRCCSHSGLESSASFIWKTLVKEQKLIQFCGVGRDPWILYWGPKQHLEIIMWRCWFAFWKITFLSSLGYTVHQFFLYIWNGLSGIR